MYPQDQWAPSFRYRADMIRAEFSAKAPKLRLSVFAYMVENDIEIHVDKIDEIVQYVAAYTDEYADWIETFDPNDVDVVDLDVEGDDPYGNDDGRYL